MRNFYCVLAVFNVFWVGVDFNAERYGWALFSLVVFGFCIASAIFYDKERV